MVDIVGQIVEIGNVEILNVNNKQTKRLTMELRDTKFVSFTTFDTFFVSMFL